jgi:predicted amidohydrolase
MKKKYHQKLNHLRGGDKRMDSKGRILIRGGTVVDPASSVLGQADVLIHNDKIAADSDDKTDKVIDAAGCLILPGLIDYLYNHSKIGVNPDLALLPQGITTAVDQGSAGVTNAADFLKLVIEASQVRVFAHLHVSPAGLTTLPDRLEDVDPSLYDLQHSHGLIANHDRFIGLEIRQGEVVYRNIEL